MQATITWVGPTAREWEGNYGPSAAVKVRFQDGTEGEYVTKPDKAADHITRLTTLIGKPSEFEVDASKQKEYQGVVQHRIKGYPGKPEAPQGGGGGGGRQYVPAWGNTEEGERFIQERMDRRTAVMKAVEAKPTWEMADLLKYADQLYTWLRASVSVPAAPKEPAPVSTPAEPQNSPQGTTGGKANGSKPNLTPEEAACRQGMVWLKTWIAEAQLPETKEMRCAIATEALSRPVDDMKALSSLDWATVKTHCQSLTDADIKGWQAVSKNVVGAKA